MLKLTDYLRKGVSQGNSLRFYQPDALAHVSQKSMLTWDFGG